MHSEDADGRETSNNPDQTTPFCTICPNLIISSGVEKHLCVDDFRPSAIRAIIRTLLKRCHIFVLGFYALLSIHKTCSIKTVILFLLLIKI